MTFDWEHFLRSNSIVYITSGKNCPSGGIALACPFCADDPSQHMTINLMTGVYGCWRDRRHSGNRPERLICALLACSWAEASRIVGSAEEEKSLSPGEIPALGLRERIYSAGKRTTIQPRGISFESNMHPIIQSRSSAQRFVRYLYEDRGFAKDAIAVARVFNLQYCAVGEWAMRVIIPICLDGALLGWTARSILPDVELRYITHPKNGSIKETLFNFDRCAKGGNSLVIVEGPFGAMKVDFCGKPCGFRSVATLGTVFSESQISLVHKLAPRFSNIYILFDPGAEAVAMNLQSNLQSCGTPVYVKFLPEGIDGPDDMSGRQIRKMLGGWRADVLAGVIHS